MDMECTLIRHTFRQWALPWMLLVVIALHCNHRILSSKAAIAGHVSASCHDVAPVSFFAHRTSTSRRKRQTSLSFIPPINDRQDFRSKLHGDKTNVRSSDVKVPNINDNDLADVGAYQIDNGTIYRFRGIVETGYGRGGKKLGFPTANLGPSTFFDTALRHISTGVYFGYAMIEQTSSLYTNDNSSIDANNYIANSNRDDIYKAVVNIGYSPTFVGNENKMKIIEAHLLLPESSSGVDFYNTTMRLQLMGYLRPEMKFTSLPDLIQQITNDIDTANQLFVKDPYNSTEWVQDPFFVFDPQHEQTWIGKSGGNSTASYEILPVPIATEQ
jgi:riboflavin kinase